jgi:hypothetical protein
MSEAILLTGKRGEGKTLIATMLVKRYLSQGRPVATNVNFNLDKLASPWNKTNITRLPDYPLHKDFQALTPANLTYDESKNGLLLLDEVSGFLNSHDWRAADTKLIRFWLAQSRKDGWDLLFLTQDAKQIDAQIRNSLFELHGIARNMSKVGIPFISFLFQWFFNVKIRMPSYHVFTERYGFNNNAALANTELISGSGLFECYDTKQKINPDAALDGSPQLYGSAPATMLSAWYLRGRYMGVFRMYGKIAFFMIIIGGSLGLTGGYLWGHFSKDKPKNIKASMPLLSENFVIDSKLKAIGNYQTNGLTTVLLNDGSSEVSSNFKMDSKGSFYYVRGVWVGE